MWWTGGRGIIGNPERPQDQVFLFSFFFLFSFLFSPHALKVVIYLPGQDLVFWWRGVMPPR